MTNLEYDYFIVAFSGGKDSLACLLHLLELGIPRSKIECWHHLVDGREGQTFFDWPCTEDYCRKVCEALSIPIYFSWREGGLTREMLRLEAPTAAAHFETPSGGLKSSGGKSKKTGTRQRFPQTSASMNTRWCSSYGKISIGNTAIANQERFLGKRVLLISGERREESPGRAKYPEFEPHPTTTKARQVDRWRAVIDWEEADIWEIIKRWNLRSHPSYELGFGRCSCAICIFASNDQLASVYKIAPHIIEKMANYEQQFADFWGKYTIHRKQKVMDRIAIGNAYPMETEIIKLSQSATYYDSVLVSPEDWKLPPGAFNKDIAGPT